MDAKESHDGRYGIWNDCDFRRWEIKHTKKFIPICKYQGYRVNTVAGSEYWQYITSVLQLNKIIKKQRFV